jgi:hypothetical protein
VIGNDVAEDAAHVRDDDRRLHQLGKEVLFHARGWGLRPAQLARRLQEARRQVAEQGIGIANLGGGVVVVARIDDLHRRGGGENLLRRDSDTDGEMTSFIACVSLRQSQLLRWCGLCKLFMIPMLSSKGNVDLNRGAKADSFGYGGCEDCAELAPTDRRP